ncbi:MBL fold metallo-hydrolase [Tardiphaga alba]|uniref:MBL fold metallo-hydrolase n=1 Tax=Tardiphaga alba TaxID=340268 RepID=A0ABX8A8J5_9BRAD|nr:MBL fold metallo-hydrolase [Tardiphaga alba]QUS38610.1 MBL fold metallo-hydrolase [Tardiphaga alba]
MRPYAILLATFLAASGLPAFAQTPAPATAVAPDFSKVEIKTTDLGDGVYMLEGMGGNITLATAKSGAILIDSQFAPLHDKIKAAIAKVTPQPVKYLVNTHFHGDHTGGNEAFAKDGATIVANVKLKTKLRKGSINFLTGGQNPPAPKAAWPATTYTNQLKLSLRGRIAELRHIKNAHTDGDTYVYLKSANVIATGDTFTNGRYPNIDVLNGGNIKGMIAAADTYLRLSNDKTKIVPGHGPLGDKAALTAYRDMLITARDRIAKLVKAGKSEDEVQAAKPFADLDTKWAPNETASKNFVRAVYGSLAPKKAGSKS